MRVHLSCQKSADVNTPTSTPTPISERGARVRRTAARNRAYDPFGTSSAAPPHNADGLAVFARTAHSSTLLLLTKPAPHAAAHPAAVCDIPRGHALFVLHVWSVCITEVSLVLTAAPDRMRAHALTEIRHSLRRNSAFQVSRRRGAGAWAHIHTESKWSVRRARSRRSMRMFLRNAQPQRAGARASGVPYWAASACAASAYVERTSSDPGPCAGPSIQWSP